VWEDGEEAMMILVGNKCDFRAGEKVVSRKEGEALARDLGIGFIETSALTMHNVEEIFSQIVRMIRMNKERIVEEAILQSEI